MTTIEHLQVFGIRSFAPNPNNKQTVTFQKPLTVILGKNGAGKTTIIEALLYACAGIMPPGSGTEKSTFVYDPNVIGESEVKAQVRLSFTGKGDNEIKIIRSFNATRTRAKTTFSTLDNTISIKDKNTNKEATRTYRASDVDRIVPELLGVSPAVLEHVIFCHQEDANWPLAPSKDVKWIFDDIFSAKRFVLALEQLKEIKKELNWQQKQHEGSLLTLRGHRDQANQLESDINAKEETIRSLQERNKAIGPEMEKLHTAMRSLDAIEEKISHLTREATLLQGRIYEREEWVETNHLPPSNFTLEELKEKLGRLDQHAQTEQGATAEKEERLRLLENARIHREQQILLIRSELDRIEQLDHQCTDYMRALQTSVSENYPQLNHGVIPQDHAGLQMLVENAEQELKVARTRKGQKLKEISDNIMALESKKQDTLRICDVEKNKKEMLFSQIESLRKKKKDAEDSLHAFSSVNEEQLDAIKTKINLLEQRVEAANELKKKGKNHELFELVNRQLDTQNTLVSALRRELSERTRRSMVESQLQSWYEQVREGEQTFNHALNHEIIPLLSEYAFPAPSHPPTVPKIQEMLIRLRSVSSHNLKQVSEEQQKKRIEFATMEQKKIYALEELAKAEELVACKSGECLKVFTNVEQFQYYEDELLKAKEAYAISIKKKNTMDTLSSCYGDFIQIAKASKICAACERPFPDSASLEAFVLKSESKCSGSSESVEQLNTEVHMSEDRLRALEKIEGALIEVRMLQSRIPILKRQIIQLSEDMTASEILIKNLDEQKSKLEDEISRIEDLNGRLAPLHSIYKEVSVLRERIKAKEKEFTALQGTHSDTEPTSTDSTTPFSGKATEDLEEEFKNANELLNQLYAQRGELQRREDGLSEHAVELELADERSKFFQLEAQLSKKRVIIQTAAQLDSDIATLLATLQITTEREEEMRGQAKALEVEISPLVASQHAAEQAYASEMDAMEETFRNLRQLSQNILQHLQSGLPEKLISSRDLLQTTLLDKEREDAEIESLTAELEQARKTLNTQHVDATHLRQAVEFLEKKKAVAEDKEKLLAIEEKLNALKKSNIEGIEEILGENVHMETLPRIREIVRLRIAEFDTQRAHQQGSVEAILQDLNRVRSQLKSEKFKDIEKRYRSTFLKVQTTEIAVRDLDRYYSVLEKAIQSYHQEKIAQINNVIADLWGQTYRGSDIDTVKICSEVDASNRRSYNYRVVMMRGNSEIGMRGRCSAGQKVLASVIIRLALSEVFCCECGILALDEPTTNLDEDNARSLAESLRILIDSRRAAKNFQLVVITHDEQFVRALGGNTLDTFYYVHKDREGAFSVIEERTFHQLFA